MCEQLNNASLITIYASPLDVFQRQPDDSGAITEVKFAAPTTIYQASSHVGTKRFVEYSWSKPLKDPVVKTKLKRKKRLPAQSSMHMMSPENDRVSRSFEVPRASPIGRDSRANVSMTNHHFVHSMSSLDDGGRHSNQPPQQHSDGESPWLGESSVESIGDDISLGECSVESLGALPNECSMSDVDKSYDSGGAERRGEGEDSVDSMQHSIRGLLDRKREELSEVEAKYLNIKQGKLKLPKIERKKKDSQVPAVMVANALMQENFESELAVLNATLNLHKLTNQCGDELSKVWGLEKVHKKGNHLKIPSSDVAQRILSPSSLAAPPPDKISSPGMESPVCLFTYLSFTPFCHFCLKKQNSLF